MSNRIYPHPIIAREGWPILAGALIAVIVSWMLDLGIITFLFFTNPETGEDAVKVSIFMNVFNVHSQKSPVAGVVEKVTYTPGLFVNADLDKASTENERNAVTVRMADGRRITFIQVAGLVARRIICYATIGQELARGERYGFIRFGSRVDVYLPADAEIVAQIGDKMTGVSSTIARL